MDRRPQRRLAINDWRFADHFTFLDTLADLHRGLARGPHMLFEPNAHTLGLYSLFQKWTNIAEVLET